MNPEEYLFQKQPCRISDRLSQCGFTLVELITVMVIVSVLAVAAIPRFYDNDVFQSRGAADQVKSAFRFGQKVAIAQHRNVTVNIMAAHESNCGITLIGGDINCVISDTVSVTPALPQAIIFSALGRPNAGASWVVGATTINVEAETGYVH